MKARTNGIESNLATSINYKTTNLHRCRQLKIFIETGTISNVPIEIAGSMADLKTTFAFGSLLEFTT